MAIAAIVVIVWLACAVLTAGMDFAYFQGKFPTIAKESRREHMGSAWLSGLLFGPLGTVIVFFCTGFAKHGWRLR